MLISVLNMVLWISGTHRGVLEKNIFFYLNFKFGLKYLLVGEDWKELEALAVIWVALDCWGHHNGQLRVCSLCAQPMSIIHICSPANRNVWLKLWNDTKLSDFFYLEYASFEIFCTKSTGLRLIEGVHSEMMVFVCAAWRIDIVPGRDKQTTLSLTIKLYSSQKLDKIIYFWANSRCHIRKKLAQEKCSTLNNFLNPHVTSKYFPSVFILSWNHSIEGKNSAI